MGQISSLFMAALSICSSQISFLSTTSKKRNLFFYGGIQRQKRHESYELTAQSTRGFCSFLNFPSVAKFLSFPHPNFTPLISHLQYPNFARSTKGIAIAWWFSVSSSCLQPLVPSHVHLPREKLWGCSLPSPPSMAPQCLKLRTKTSPTFRSFQNLA